MRVFEAADERKHLNRLINMPFLLYLKVRNKWFKKVSFLACFKVILISKYFISLLNKF